MVEIQHVGCACSPSTVKLRWLGGVMVSVVAFAAVELWVSRLSHSLTLKADSAHMLNDGAALAIALLATWIARRSLTSASARPRIELVAALINGLGLLAMALWIGREALNHLYGPPLEILSTPMLITAILGLGINGLNLYWLHGDLQGDLNLRGAVLHVVADLLGSIGAIAAALAVAVLHCRWADVVIGVGVAVLIAGSALPLIWQSVQQLAQPRRPPQPSADVGWLEVGCTDLATLVESGNRRPTP